MSIHRLLAAFSTTGLLVASAACGAGDGASEADVAAITATATAVVLAADPGVCATHLTAEFVTSFFGDQPACRDSAAAESGEVRATGARVGDISVDGDSATATVTEEGGDSNGASGQWRFARDGDGWRVSAWSADYLRSQLTASLGAEYEPDGEGDPFADPATRECLVERLLDRSDEDFLAMVKEIFRETEASEKLFLDTFIACGEEEVSPGVTRLRLAFEASLRSQPGVPTAVVECLIAALRERVSDAELRELFRENEQQAAAVQRKTAEAATQCARASGA